MTIFLHEIIRTVPGQEEPYMASVLSIVEAPSRMEEERDGQLGMWRTAEASGPWPKVVNIWQHAGWHTLFQNLRRQFTDVQRDSPMEEWWQSNLHLRTGGYDRVLLATGYSPSGNQAIAEQGIKGRVFLHEIHALPMGEPAGFLDRLGKEFVPAAEGYGWSLVGAYRVAWRPREALTIFAMSEWSDLARLLQSRESDSALKSWFAYRDGIVQNTDEMLMMAGRLNPMAQYPP